jgi:cytochrome P450
MTIFFAGMKTIQASTTNLIYYLAKHPQVKADLLAEVIPAVEQAKDDIVQNL